MNEANNVRCPRKGVHCTGECMAIPSAVATSLCENCSLDCVMALLVRELVPYCYIAK